MFSTNVFAEREAKNESELDLLYAVKNDKTESAFRLIHDGVAVGIIDKYERSLLMYAAQNNNKELVKFLIKKGADPNYQIIYRDTDESSSPIDGENVLDFGIKSNDTKMVDLLIKLGAKLNVKKKDVETAICNASLNNNVDMVRYLLKKGVKVSNEKGQYLVVSHMKQKEDPLYKQMVIRKNSDFRIVKIWEDYGISINENTLIKTKLLEKKNITKYITAYKEWKAGGSPDPEPAKPQEIEPNPVDEAKLDSLTKEAEARAVIERAKEELLIKDQAETRAKELKIVYYSILVVIICFLCRKKIVDLWKLISKKISKMFKPSLNKGNQPQYTRKPINIVRQPISERESIGKPVYSSEKGWDVDDTKNLDVNYLTIEDIINPIRMTNQHERYVREMIWYIRKVEKVDMDKKEAYDALLSKWKQVNPKLVRSVYKRSLFIILQTYSKQNSKVNQLTKLVKAK